MSGSRMRVAGFTSNMRFSRDRRDGDVTGYVTGRLISAAKSNTDVDWNGSSAVNMVKSVTPSAHTSIAKPSSM